MLRICSAAAYADRGGRLEREFVPAADAVSPLLERAWQSARGVAEVMESGQVRRPLTDRLDEVGGLLGDQTLRALVLTLGAGSPERVLAWISGKDCPPLGALLERRLFEVQFSTGGFSLMGPSGQWRHFVRAEDFAAAILSDENPPHHDDPGAWVMPARVVLPACEDVAGVRLLVSGSAGSLADPGAFAALAPWLGLVIIIGHADANPPEPARSAIGELTSLAEICLPLILLEQSRDPADGTGTGAPDWWRDRGLLGSKCVLPPLRWSGSGPPPVPAFLRESSSAPRRTISRAPTLRAISMMCGLLGSELTARDQRLERRLAGTMRRLRGLAESARRAAGAVAEELHARAAWHVAALETRLRENALASGRLESPALSVAMDIVDSADSRAPVRGGGAGMSPALPAGFVEDLTSSISAGLAGVASRDQRAIRDGLEALRADLSGQIGEVLGRPCTLELQANDAGVALAGVVPVKGMGGIGRSEPGPPGPSLARHLFSGPQFLVTITVLLSLSGVIVGLRRDSVLLFALAMVGLIASAASTLVSWRQKQSEDRHQGLQTVRGALRSEVVGVAETTLHARLEQWRRLVDDAHREIVCQIDAAIAHRQPEPDRANLEQQEALLELSQADQHRRQGLALLQERIVQTLQLLEHAGGIHEGELGALVEQGLGSPRTKYAGRY